MHTWGPLLVTCAIAAASTVVGILLYRFSESSIRQKGVRFSGAAAIAIAAYLGMSRFYVQLGGQLRSAEEAKFERALRAIDEYETCREQRREFACMDPANDLSRACEDLLPDP